VADALVLVVLFDRMPRLENDGLEDNVPFAAPEVVGGIGLDAAEDNIG
jgi:hypothetical protein